MIATDSDPIDEKGAGSPAPFSFEPRLHGMINVNNQSDGNLFNVNPVAQSGSTADP